MSFYSEKAATAHRMLTKFGAKTTITRTVPGTYDPAAGAAPLTPTTSDCTAAVFPYEDKHIDGTLIQSGDQQAYLSAVGLADPAPGDALLWRGETYTVVRGKILAPAGVAVLYELQVRR